MQKVKSSGYPQPTVKFASSDTSKTLSGLGVTIEKASTVDGGRGVSPSYATVSVETNAVRVNRGGTATTTVGDLLQPGDSVRLEGAEITLAQFVSAASGVHGDLQISVEY